MAPEARSDASNFDPNGPSMVPDFDFANFDLGDIDVANFGFNNIQVHFDNFDLGDLNITNGMNYGPVLTSILRNALREAELLLGPRETFQEANISSLSCLPPLKISSQKSDAVLTLVEATITGTSRTISFQRHAGSKAKKDEVDKGHILPEGLHQNLNKT